jgi:TPR repeat protein
MKNYLLYLQHLSSKIFVTLFLIIFLSSCTSNDKLLIQKLTNNALKPGEGESKFELIRIYSEGKAAPKNISKASKWLKALADDGNEYLLKKLAYRKDIGSEEINKLALQYLYTYSQYHIGTLYLSGFDIYSNVAAEYNSKNSSLSKNNKEIFYSNALRYLKLSASQGYCPAQHNLAYMYYSGLGTPKNYKDSLFWTKKAAEECYYFDYGIHGLLLELYFLGGFGIQKNIPKAYQEFFLIADNSLNQGQYKNFYKTIKQLKSDELNELIRFIIEYISEPTQDITNYNAHAIIIAGLLKTYFIK